MARRENRLISVDLEDLPKPQNIQSKSNHERIPLKTILENLEIPYPKEPTYD